MTDAVEASRTELLEIWRRLDEDRRQSLLRVARALDESRQGQPGEQIIEQDGGGWGVGQKSYLAKGAAD
jgi:hypothetical protein